MNIQQVYYKVDDSDYLVEAATEEEAITKAILCNLEVGKFDNDEERAEIENPQNYEVVPMTMKDLKQWVEGDSENIVVENGVVWRY